MTIADTLHRQAIREIQQDITPTLQRQAIHEVMDELNMSLEDISKEVGYHLMTMRVWLNRPGTEVPKMQERVERFLAKLPPLWTPPKPAAVVKAKGRPRRDPSLPKVCSRCGRHPGQVEFYSNGYCKPCMREYERVRYQAKKAKTAGGADLASRAVDVMRVEVVA